MIAMGMEEGLREAMGQIDAILASTPRPEARRPRAGPARSQERRGAAAR